MSHATRLDNLSLSEASGVDHPAHLVEGWMVLKSTTDLTDDEIAAVLKQADDAAAAEVEASSIEKGADSVSDTTNEDVTAVEVDEEALIKALPEPIRKRLQAVDELVAVNKALAETVQKEREQRLDSESVAKAREAYGSIPGLDPETFGPALRKAAEAAPEAVAEIEKALAAASTALKESDEDLAKEVGHSVVSGAGSTETSRNTESGSSLDDIAKAIAKNEDVDYVTALTKAAQENPALYIDHINATRKGE